MALSTEKREAVTGSTGAVRQAEFRSRHARLDVPISLPIGKTIEDLASQYDCSKAVVVRSLLRFALTNRDWKTQGLLWRE